MHVAVPKEESNSFSKSLKSSELKELDIQATRLNRRKTCHKSRAVMGMKIHCVGNDRCVSLDNTAYIQYSLFCSSLFALILSDIYNNFNLKSVNHLPTRQKIDQEFWLM